MQNIIYIATSLDGFIADKDGRIDWLNSIPITEEVEKTFSDFLHSIDAIVMGRNTFETVLSFDIDWPYSKRVFVASSTLTSIPEQINDRAEIITDTPEGIVKTLTDRGYSRLYIDGGITIQSFLNAKLIDEMIVTTIPIILGGGLPLFSELSEPQEFTLIESKILSNTMVQSTYRKK